MPNLFYSTWNIDFYFQLLECSTRACHNNWNKLSDFDIRGFLARFDRRCKDNANIVVGEQIPKLDQHIRSLELSKSLELILVVD